MQYVGSKFRLGNGKAGDEILEINNAGATKPALKYNDTSKKWQYTNDGSSWMDMGSGGGSTTTVSNSAPSSPNTNDLWIDTSS